MLYLDICTLPRYVPLETSEHMIFRQAQESGITVIKRPTLPLEKQSLICSQFKMINKWQQRICKSFAKDKMPPEKHQETVVRGKSCKEVAPGSSNAQAVPCSPTCPKETNVHASWGGGSKGSTREICFEGGEQKKFPSNPSENMPLS